MSYTATERPHYDDDDLNSEEEEEERLLSAEHGEASDDGPKRKRPTSTTTYSEADAAAAKEFEEKVRVKKSRPVLTPADLKGSKGLIAIRRSFPDQIKFREHKKAIGTGAKSSSVARKMNEESQITSAANYASSLMAAYKHFARALFPSLAPEDVLLKVEDMGSKKEIKDYLQIMRNDVRREYLEGIYGEEKTERILHELENGVSRPVVEEFENERPVNRRMGEAVLDEVVIGGDVERAAVSNPYEKAAAADEEAPKDVGTDVSESDEEEELEFVSDKKTIETDEAVNSNEKLDNVEDNVSAAGNVGDNQDNNADVDESVGDTQETDEEIEHKEDDNLGIDQENKRVGSSFNDSSDEVVHETAHDEVLGQEDLNASVEESFASSEEKTVTETQETLTLVASQFGDEEITDEVEDAAMEDINNTEDAGESYFNSQFTNTQYENTEDERFSQSNVHVTYSESAFEVEEQMQNDEVEDRMNLGQTQGEPSQFSMEY
jgi:hypothetical protein